MRDLIRKILSEQEDDKYYTISAEEYTDLMKFTSYSGKALTKLKKFGGKPLKIVGNLDLSSTPTDSLGNVAVIEGNLYINNTNVSDISGIDIMGYVRDYGTPIEKRRIAKEQQAKRNLADERRKTNEWELETTDEIGEKAHALFEYLVGQGDIEEPDEEQKIRIEKLKKILVILNKRYDECEGGCLEILNRIEKIEDALEEATEDVVDVYNIIPTKYGFYDLTSFEVIDVHDLFRNEYAVGTESEMDSSLEDYCKNLIDDIGVGGFNQYFIERHIDESALRDEVEGFYEDSIRDSPESYFDDSDFQLTEEQEKRIEQLQDYLQELEDYISDKENEQNNLESEIEDPEEYEKAWDDIQNLINDAEKKKDEAQEELDGIEPDKEPTEEMIEQKVREFVDDALDDPYSYIKNHGYDLESYVDKDEMAKSLADEEGYGQMNGYDGSYDTIRINNETYYIMRTS